MKYIDAIKGGTISILIFTPLVILIPGQGSTPIIETILTVASLFFAILTGFFISRLNSRYNEIRELIAAEDAILFSMFEFSKFYSKELSKKLANQIDKYYITTFEYNFDDYYKPSTPYLLNMYTELNKFRRYRDNSVFANLVSKVSELEHVRNKSSVISKERLTRSQWIVLIGLAAIIMTCLLYVSSNQLFFQTLIILTAAILTLILLTLRDLQNFRLGGKAMPVLESSQEVLEIIGKKRYYNKFLLEIKAYEIPDYVKEYRLGLHMPGDPKQKIKLIKEK